MVVLLGARWIRFTTPFNYTLSTGDGVKTVYYNKDEGNESKTIMKIILDTKPPQGIGVTMDIPSNYITDPDNLKIGVILKAKDAKYYQQEIHQLFTVINGD